MDRDAAISYVHKLLATMLEKNASDLYITADAAPSAKIASEMVPLTTQALNEQNARMLVRAIMNDRQLKQFEEEMECNFSISLPGKARFRVNTFTQRGCAGMVLRHIPSHIPGLKELGLPPVLRDIAMTKRGLVIMVGATGSGKSTTLASMVDFRNTNSKGHIITIEDPIEFVHQHKGCLITQREIGVDTANYEIAMKNTLRQAPDVILLGEIRDRESMDYAIAYAETGHLCLTTLHANSSNQAIDRIINFFPEERRNQLLMDLSLNLKAVVSQRLVRKAKGEGRLAAVEVVINTPLMADLILKGDVPGMKILTSKSREHGMRTFDQALFDLIEARQITVQEALRHADSQNDLRLRLKLESRFAQDNDFFKGLDDLAIEPMEKRPLMTIMTETDMRITPLLNMMVKQDASDLYLTTGAHATIKVRTQLRRISREPMKPGNIRQLAEEILTATEIEAFFADRELNKGFSLKGIGRFRMNFYFQRGEVSMVIRHIRSDIRTPEELKLPEVLKKLVMQKEGLLLFVGSTGSGKSTSMASLIQYRNENHCGHILTIEDPIEYTFRHGKSIIGQREVGFDTLSYANAMREAMREAPNMIMVGEVRNTETMEAVLGFADTGHLVLSTLHATNVIQALERILYLFPSENKHRVLMDLSLNLRGIVAQRLIPDDKDRLHLVAEVLINTPYVAELIRTGQFGELKPIIAKGTVDGMQTFDQALYQLYSDKHISKQIALEYAGSRNDLEWQINFGTKEDNAGVEKGDDISNGLPAFA